MRKAGAPEPFVVSASRVDRGLLLFRHCDWVPLVPVFHGHIVPPADPTVSCVARSFPQKDWP